MGQFESVDAYLARLLNLEVLTWVAFWFALFLVFRKRLAKVAGLRIGPTLVLAGALAGVLGFSIRPWDANGVSETFWMFDTVLWGIAWQVGGNWILNAVLYLPLSLLLVYYGKHPVVSWVALVGLSAAIETLQSFTRLGVGDPADFVSNCFGALVGVLVGTLLRRRTSPRKR